MVQHQTQGSQAARTSHTSSQQQQQQQQPASSVSPEDCGGCVGGANAGCNSRLQKSRSWQHPTTYPFSTPMLVLFRHQRGKPGGKRTLLWKHLDKNSSMWADPCFYNILFVKMLTDVMMTMVLMEWLLVRNGKEAVLVYFTQKKNTTISGELTSKKSPWFSQIQVESTLKTTSFFGESTLSNANGKEIKRKQFYKRNWYYIMGQSTNLSHKYVHMLIIEQAESLLRDRCHIKIMITITEAKHFSYSTKNLH